MLAFDTYTFLLSVEALAYLAVASGVLWTRGTQVRLTNLLAALAGVSGLWAFSQMAAGAGWLTLLTAGFVARMPSYWLLLLAWVLLYLNRAFLRLEGSPPRWWMLGGAGVVVAVVLGENLLALTDILQITPRVRFYRDGVAYGFLLAQWAASLGGAVALTARSYAAAQQPLHRNRITVWWLALGCMVMGAVQVFSGVVLLGSLFHLVGTLFAAYVVLTVNLPDVRQLTRRALGFLIVTSFTAALLWGAFLLAQQAIWSAAGGQPALAAAVVAVVAAALLVLLLGPFQRGVAHVVSGAGYSSSRTVREYSASISNILDLGLLSTLVLEHIREAMNSRRGALFVVGHGTEGAGSAGGDGRLVLRDASGLGENLPTGSLNPEGLIGRHLAYERRPLTQYEIDLLPAFEEADPEERAWLADMDMDVYVPVLAKDNLIGLIALGPKASGDRYFEEDLDLLSTLSDQTAVGLENARLFHDLTVRNEENESLNQQMTAANRELARLDQAKSNFIDIASHELRTPLSQLRGYNEILEELIGEASGEPAIVRDMNQGFNTAVNRLEEIVEIMFDVSRLDMGTLDLDLAPIPVGYAVNLAAQTWDQALKERDIVLRVGNLSNLPPVFADPKRLAQVFIQLVQNAVKYTPNGGQIRIIGRRLEPGAVLDGECVEVIVSDTGVGIDRDELENVFGRFFRADDIMSHSTSETKFKGAGLGLGLFITRGIVQAHGGRIWADSTGHDEDIFPGSQFHVVLPVVPTEQPSE